MIATIKKHVVTILVIITVGFVAYAVISRHVRSIERFTAADMQGTRPLQEIRSNLQHTVYTSMLSEVLNDRRGMYILIIGSSLALAFVLYGIFRLWLQTDWKALIFPDRYVVIPKENLRLHKCPACGRDADGSYISGTTVELPESDSNREQN